MSGQELRDELVVAMRKLGPYATHEAMATIVLAKVQRRIDAAVARAEQAEQAVARVREWVKEDGESALVFKVSIRRALDGPP